MLIAHLASRVFVALSVLGIPVALPGHSHGTPYFEDGFLGLSQQELHDKLGMPQAVRDRKSALRVFTYYPITDWAKYFSKLVSPENGEDVYTFQREGVDVRYSFSYAVDPNDHNEGRLLTVRLVDIEFSPAVPMSRLPSLIPEFRPSNEPSSPSFRSNIWILLFKGLPSPDARFIVREHGKDQLDWTLSYQLFSMQGLPDRLTGEALIDRVEISTQSLQLVTLRQRHTHERIANPYSDRFDKQSDPPKSPSKSIPIPKYAE
ncbi:MAG: hypothetical protein A4E19_19000 [Nitrospira sp. SG-bin1]|nr:MAG: hypothetical protein A4E19_19000 [Nitrospira sp. SG-bin1]